ncbi:UNVERIFIED_CONTAM: hypothetical protein PYX00_002570 [Menopon gallinae]|uniref:Serpin domain-containing protein n=1 Tax=Menopon gallinae TaxID=328185 RepID=A0AAW2IHB8_9NEOP
MILLLCLCLPAVVLGQCITDDDQKPVKDPSARISLYKGQQRFSIGVLKVLNEFQSDRNIFFSPHSMYQSLLLAYIAASNETERAIQKALHLPETQSKLTTIQNYGLEKYFQSMREVNGSSDYEFKTCNKIYLSPEIKPRECMAKLLNEELEVVNFGEDPESARKRINSWVEKTTKAHIKELLSPDAVHENTKLILANAAYFKGLWKSKFLAENTKKNSLFYVRTDDIKIVDLMAQKGTFNYMISETLKAHILELPYKGDEISMIVMLPPFEKNAVDDLIKRLSEDSLEDIIDFDDLYPRQVEIEFPKFTVEQTLDMRPVFEKLGLSEVFGDEGDFSTLTGEGADVHFTDAIHKSKIEVDEDGTVAAAATAIFTFRSSRPLEPTKFIANHPFIYFIYDKMSQNILFMGVYRVPEKKYRNGKRIVP